MYTCTLSWCMCAYMYVYMYVYTHRDMQVYKCVYAQYTKLLGIYTCTCTFRPHITTPRHPPGWYLHTYPHSHTPNTH